MREITVGNLTKGMRYCIKGNIHTPIIGKVYDIKGEMDYSPTWGEQISILESSMNNDLAETDIRGQKYILCKLFPKHVQRMYETLDNPYLALKEGNVKELTKIKGCGPNVATKWIEKFNDTYAPYIELGYAITCHSAQGSQFDTVIGGIDFSMFIMLNKELLYTMITRASKKFILCAQTKALQYAITKEQIIHRQTYLMDDLDELCNKKFDF